MKKIFRFLRSFWLHVWAGFPKSTQKQINERHEICQGCEYHNKKEDQCLVCGCNINTKKIFMNKLAWADQECPVGKWTKISG